MHWLKNDTWSTSSTLDGSLEKSLHPLVATKKKTDPFQTCSILLKFQNKKNKHQIPL